MVKVCLITRPISGISEWRERLYHCWFGLLIKDGCTIRQRCFQNLPPSQAEPSQNDYRKESDGSSSGPCQISNCQYELCTLSLSLPPAMAAIAECLCTCALVTKPAPLSEAAIEAVELVSDNEEEMIVFPIDLADTDVDKKDDTVELGEGQQPSAQQPY